MLCSAYILFSSCLLSTLMLPCIYIEDECLYPMYPGTRLVNVVFRVFISGKKLGQGWKHNKGTAAVKIFWICIFVCFPKYLHKIWATLIDLKFFFFMGIISAVRSSTVKGLPSALLVGSFCRGYSLYSG